MSLKRHQSPCPLNTPKAKQNIRFIWPSSHFHLEDCTSGKRDGQNFRVSARLPRWFNRKRHVLQQIFPFVVKSFLQLFVQACLRSIKGIAGGPFLPMLLPWWRQVSVWCKCLTWSNSEGIELFCTVKPELSISRNIRLSLWKTPLWLV